MRGVSHLASFHVKERIIMSDQDKSMNILEHLDELRKRLMITIGAFLLFFIIAFIFIGDIYDWFVKDFDQPLTILGPLDIVWIYFALAGVIALALTVPVFILQLWLFVKPALTPQEHRATVIYIPASFLLFVAGLLFGYYIVVPILFDFLLSLGGDSFNMMFTPQKYFQFILRIVLPISILFEMPIVVMFLTSIGIITPNGMMKNRKYAYFGLFVTSVLITPPDFISPILMSIPLIFLYEISIYVSKLVYRKKLKREAQYSEKQE